MLIGQDPTNLNALHQKMDAVIRGQQLSKSAVDMAAYDQYLAGDLTNYVVTDDEVANNLKDLEHLI